MSNTPARYIIRCVATSKDTGEVEHSFYTGPYDDESVASDAAETMEASYEARNYRVDGEETHISCYVELLTPAPLFGRPA